jgi:epoxyqueuosine reductase
VNFLRNIAIGLGNATADDINIEQLKSRLGQHNDILNEHIHWAIEEQTSKLTANKTSPSS